MRKLTNVLLSFMVCGTVLTSSAFASEPVKVNLNGKNIQFNVAPIVEQTSNGGVTLVQFRTIFEALGMTVSWDANTQTITGKSDKNIVLLKVGSKSATVNGKSYTLDIAPKIVDGYTMIPLRFIGESTGNTVGWNQSTQTVSIAKSNVATTTSSTTSTTPTSVNNNVSNQSSSSTTPPPYAYKHLPVYWNGKKLDETISFYSNGSWYIHVSDFFASLGIGGDNFLTSKTSNGRDDTIKFDNNVYQFNDNDGVYINGNKIADLKFIDYSGVPLDTISKALQCIYTVDENGVYITK